MVNTDASLETTAQQAATLAQDYLKNQLGLTVEQSVVQVKPANHQRKLTVV